MNVLILCAGYGRRLAPLTDRVPKPLVTIADTTSLEIQIERCAALSYRNMCINTHHLAEVMHHFATEVPITKVFYEPELLGTGGPLWRMYAEEYHDDLLVINCDIYHNFDLCSFVAQAQGSLYSLLLIDNPQFNTVEVSSGLVTGVKKHYSQAVPDACLTFSGVSWYSKEALSRIKKNHFSIVSFWQEEAMRQSFGRAITQKNAVWIDIGTPQGLYAASFKRAKERGIPLINGSLIGKNAEISSGVSIRNSIILEGTKVASGSYSNLILGEGIEWNM